MRITLKNPQSAITIHTQETLKEMIEQMGFHILPWLTFTDINWEIKECYDTKDIDGNNIRGMTTNIMIDGFPYTISMQDCFISVFKPNDYITPEDTKRINTLFNFKY